MAVRWAGRAPKTKLDRQAPDLAPRDRLSVENELRKTNLEIIGAVVLIIGVAFTFLEWRATKDQLTVNQETQSSDRLVKTIGQISSSEQAEQVGGMYGLRNLAVDAAAKGDDSYYRVLDQTLSAYIRQHVPCLASCPPKPGGADPRATYTVQVALSLLGDKEGRLDRDKMNQARQKEMVDLRGVDLREMNLRGLYLGYVNFQGSNLSSSDLTDANVSNSDLRRVVLNNVIGRESVIADGTRWP
ncbi:pentapeptide repeat-containing protein [Herbihabitans rhizosphaerae]|uniref:pentapeptide repeat-containing protein n=1 Tax=Herbihabitans rhizosphaerae TaxID=1872711 RepID=UPI00102C12E9|nr:pentapeptide repeat-containing protein [Herbihabitans rhizosphaerae]